MYEKELSDILQKTINLQFPHETEEEQEIFFKEAEENDETYLFKDSEGYYEIEDEEDISIEADDKDVKKKTIKENVEPEESEYCHKIGNIYKQ